MTIPRELYDQVTTADASPPSAPRLPAAERYALLEELGRGAMGVVYAAYDSQLDRKVALKLVPEHLLGGLHQDRLRREARALAQLSHPNVVPVHDVGETAGRVYFTMEFVRGQTAAAWASEARTVDEIIAIGRAAVAGLAAAHAIGLVHRDIKPSNILIGEDGRVRVADFGIARAVPTLPADGATAPDATAVAGSPAYMAPEQLRGEIVDARCDQFGLCVTLYELLHGQRPFGGTTLAERLAAIAAGPPPPVRPVPAWLTAAITRGLAVDPAARFVDMTTLGAALVAPRRSRAPMIAVGIAVLGVAALALALRSRPEAGVEPRCDGEPLAVWTAARRSALLARLGGDHPGGEEGARLVDQLDAFAASWRDRSRAACEAARIDHTWSAELEARAGRCLGLRARSLDAALTALLDPRSPITAAAARDTVARLRSPRPCGDPDYLTSAVDLTVAPAHREAIQALDAELEAIAVAVTLGRAAEVTAQLPGLRDRVTALGYGSGLARLTYLEGELARSRGDLPTAVRLHTAAYTAARAARAPVPAAQAATALVWDHGMIGDDRARAGDWAEIAAAESATLDEHDVGINVHYTLGALADRRGEVARAIDEFRRATDLAEREHGPDHFLTAKMTASLAAVLAADGRGAESLAPHRAALAALERWEGPDAVNLSSVLGNLALTESALGLHADAEAHARRAVALAERGTEAERQGSALHNLGAVLVDADRAAEAVPLFTRAIARFTTVGLAGAAAASRVQRAQATVPAAITSRDVAQLARVRSELLAARAALVEAFGADDLGVADADLGLADLLARQSRCAEANPLFDRVQALHDRVHASRTVHDHVADVRRRCATLPR